MKTKIIMIALIAIAMTWVMAPDWVTSQPYRLYAEYLITDNSENGVDFDIYVTSADSLDTLMVSNTAWSRYLNELTGQDLAEAVRRPVSEDTADAVTVTAATTGKVFFQSRASTTVTYTLPTTVTAGLTYSFVCGDAGSEILIDPGTGIAIWTKIHAAEDGTGLAPAEGTGIKNTAATNVVGDAITLVAVNDSLWVGTSIIGLWASQ